MSLWDALGKFVQEKCENVRLRRFGGIQNCPWCRQCAQMEPGWHFELWDRDPMLDVLTCGVCGGKSLWKWEVGFIYIGALAAPTPAFPDADFYSVEHARLRAQSNNREAGE